MKSLSKLRRKKADCKLSCILGTKGFNFLLSRRVEKIWSPGVKFEKTYFFMDLQLVVKNKAVNIFI